MRLQEPKETVSFTFEGEKLEGVPGEPIAVALLANKIYRLSHSASGRKRGAFYIGPAPVEVNGRKRVNPLFKPLEAGMTIKRGHMLEFDQEPYTSRETIERKYYEVLIIGAGPAGIGAAEELKDIPHAIIERNPYIGGWAKLREHELASKTVSSDLYLSTTALGIFYKGEYVLVPAVQGDKLIEFYAKRVVLATGSVAATAVFENNDMPGIFRVDRALEVITRRKVKPGEKVILTGKKPEIIEGILKKYKIDYEYVPQIKRVEGSESVEKVYDFDGKTYEADAVIVSEGRYPDINPITQAGGKVMFRNGYFEPVVKDFSINEFVFVAGSAYRIFKDHRSSYYHGRAVGGYVLKSLGYDADPEKYLERVGEYEVYELGRIPDVNPEESFVCGCDVSVKKIRDVIRLGYTELQIIKRLTHVAMGFCQGRYCLMHTVRLLHQETGKDPNEMDIPSGRPPLRPVKMGIVR